jgi:hypothetical protein
MIQLLRLLCEALIGLFRSSARREAQILVLRHQINVLRRKAPNRPALNNIDRFLFALLTRLVPTTLDALTVVRPDTVIRWHRAGFRTYWRWKSRPRGGRPRTPPEIQQLIRDVSIANPLWGAPVHGELLKLGIDVGQTTVAKYMAKRRRPLLSRTVKQASLYSPMDQGGGKRRPVIATSGHQVSTMIGKLSLAI